MLSEQKAIEIGTRWIELWNNCTVDEYLTQYSDDIVLVSSVALRLLPDSNGRIFDKKLLKEYWELVRIRFPNYKFEIERISHFENKVLVFYHTLDRQTKAIAILTLYADNLICKVEVSYV
jgi:hypothetical protein